ncbi:MAG: response regulator [Methanocalculus sp. MSAO_Arc1]|uniref:response regulator n=1 Tax=Methanocalculus TaxID=71151 RepID=UPI000FED2881|nr:MULTISPECIES: response regulator [unclassified Methanocalculus]MCP1661690.1 CheY-like chemotaxis protein [Methanocalculus sp. AMF5]RQD81432.1 MAG: response regulator [Methanocalculus sp. MSAO_Arc1]
MNTAAILIVEDEAVTAMALKQALLSNGYSVCGVVPTAEQAVEKARDLDPDIILMDIKLAGEMSGIDAAREIMSDKNVPVIYLTAFSDEHILNQAKYTEPFGYLVNYPTLKGGASCFIDNTCITEM